MKIYITRKIPERGINKLKDKGYEIDINPEDKVLIKEELISALKSKPYDAVLCLLTDKIDKDVFEAAAAAKIFANYAAGFDNIDLKAASDKKVMVSNTPGVLTETVAEHTFALMLAISHRVVEADKLVRAGKYQGWAPMLLLGDNLSHKTLGIIGLGRIGSRVAYHGEKGFDMKVISYDTKGNGGCDTVEDVLREADFVALHVPLLDSTRHLINSERLKTMKPTAYLINTSRGPIVDEKALVRALKEKVIKGAALDVFEEEPKLAEGMISLDNIILTPHIASATEETRSKMSEMAADNIIAALEGETPPNLVKS